MSEYSELIKRFDKIRDYMREFYVYGFLSREDFDRKSLRSYDNEKRRIESYLSEFMSFRREENGKNVFLCVDSSEVMTNPLYRAFKAKSFTKNDLTLNFIILDLLYDGGAYSAGEILEKIADDYLSAFSDPIPFDLSTIRNKLSEYVDLGILTSEKQGKKLLFSLVKGELDLAGLCDALSFFSEISPLGVAGSYLLDKCQYNPDLISLKHHHLMHALDSEIVEALLEAIHAKRQVEIVNFSNRTKSETMHEIAPLRIMTGVQSGRRYIAAYHPKQKKICNYRIDSIKSVMPLAFCENYEEYAEKLEEVLSCTWGSSFRRGKAPEHLSMTLNIPHNERFIVNRVLREGRNGTLTKIDEVTYRFDISVYDTMEMLPWIRTFIGRIVSLECDNQAVVKTFYRDLEKMRRMYGGPSDVVQ